VKTRFQAFAFKFNLYRYVAVGKSLAKVAAALTAEGRKSGDVPAAVIRWGCTPKEEVYRGTLGTIAAVTAGRELSPCIMVVGQVAAMGESGGGGGGVCG
jgi:siroheme synthase